MGLLELQKERERKRKEDDLKRLAEADRLFKLEQARLKEEFIKQETSATVQQLILGFALVTCSAGINIQEIICGFESCRIRIRQLPRDAKDQDITTLFSQQGIKSSLYFLKHIRPLSDGKHLEAEIVTTALIGDLMVAALDSLPFRNETLRCEKLQAGVMDHVDVSAQTVEAIALTISCRAPTSSAIARYNSMQQTEDAIEKKNGTVFEGYKIKVEKNLPPTGPALQYYVPTSVRVTGLPPIVDLGKVRDHMLASTAKPLKSHSYNFSEFYEDLQTHLRYSSRVNMKSISTKPVDPCNKGRVQFEVQFDTWQDAKDAMDYLSEKRFKPNYPRLFLHIPPRFRYSSSIPISHYDAQERRWKALLESIKDSNHDEVELVIRTGETRKFMHLRGNDRRAVGSLKIKIENLVRGEKLAETYWHPSFCSPTGREFLANVSQQTKTLLISDWRLNALKIYHDSDRRCRNALLLVKEEVERLASQEWSVKLNYQMVGYLIRTGLQLLKEELGEEALSLDLVSRPQQLIIKAGQPSARQTVNRVLEEARNTTSKTTSSPVNTCPICYDKTTLPIELGCGHNYCLSCFRHYLVSAPDTKAFPLLCMGNEDTCKAPIPIPIIRKYLTQLQFDRLVEIAFFTYIEKNPNKIRYCPTPDCPQVYMCAGRDAENKVQQCPSCLMSICTSCHNESHTGMTCAELQLYKDPTEQERRNEVWAQENGVKRCPRCSVWIMKEEGCDHMTCLCGAHICWRCMKLFSSGDIYQHINTVHGLI